MSVNGTSKETPEGYWKDARGILTPDSLVKDIDKERDALVREIIARAEPLHKSLCDFKLSAFADIEAFIELSAEKYGASLGGKKGNVTLYTYDGRYKIQRAMQDRIAFDERLQAAKALIDECVAEWLQGARPEIIALIERAFSTNKEGEINTARVLELRRLEITDPRWLKAMEAVGEALQVISSKSYIRLYERLGDSDQYQAISLDIAGV
jgi:hypothetical protein